MIMDNNQFEVGGQKFEVPQLPSHRSGKLKVFHQIEIETGLWVAVLGAEGWASYDFVVVKDGKILEAGESQWGNPWKALADGLAWCIGSGF